MKKHRLEYFWQHKTVSENGCWLWTLNCDSDGYGRYGRMTDLGTNKAHRIAYLLSGRQIPEGHVIRHKCDIRKCINPEHLETGTPADNNRDREERGRSRWAVGEARRNSKLTEAQVRAMVDEYFLTGLEQKEVAAKWGISKASLNDILRGKKWKHLKLPKPVGDCRKHANRPRGSEV